MIPARHTCHASEDNQAVYLCIYHKLKIVERAFCESTHGRHNGGSRSSVTLSVLKRYKVLSWITCAKRPLTTSELQHALAVEVGDTKLDEDNIERIERIVSVCAGLVTVDKESGIIRLVHYTTQEYFEQMQTQFFPDAETYITTICATYLSFIVFKSGPCLTDDELEEGLQINRLYHYAPHNWGYHACEASTLSQAVMGFLENDALVEASTQTLMAFKISPEDSNYSQRFPRGVTGLHLASYFGIERAVPLLLGRNGPDSGDSYGRTPLPWAAINNHEHIATLLLESGAELEARGQSGYTPLTYAAVDGHGPVTMLLLNMGAEADAKSDGQSTPLLYAARRGHHNVVDMLLCHGAQIDSRDEENITPLGWAASGGHVAVVELLLQKGADTGLKDDDGQTPLSRAAANGNHGVVKALLALESGSLNSTDNFGQTPLSLAAESGNSAVVSLLLAAKADMDIEDYHGQTPLMIAAKNGQTHVVKMLLEDEAAVGGGKQQWYAFELAVFEGHSETELLLQEKCALEAEDFYGIRALFS